MNAERRHRLPTALDMIREGLPMRRRNDRLVRACLVVSFALYLGTVTLYVAASVLP